jgi:site-specific DNA-adenine methylase
MLASEVGRELQGCEWVGVVFAGGMSEVPYIKARTLLVNDVHRHIINLACIVGTEHERLTAALERLPFHPDILEHAQNFCIGLERPVPSDATDLFEWAVNYFITCWMGRSALAGTKGEFKGNLPVRWEPGGGDSNVRFRSAVASLDEWNVSLRRCNFTTLDFREFLKKCKDEPRHGIYSDSPFPGAGDDYRHSFVERDHRDLAEALSKFGRARVVCRFYDHPLIRELYPESAWTWRHLAGRTQANKKAPEVLLTNGPSAVSKQPERVA